MVEWDVEAKSRPFAILQWDVSASEPDEKPAKWKVFFHSAVNLTAQFIAVCSGVKV
jgi:hypothetical protein